MNKRLYLYSKNKEAKDASVGTRLRDKYIRGKAPNGIIKRTVHLETSRTLE